MEQNERKTPRDALFEAHGYATFIFVHFVTDFFKIDFSKINVIKSRTLNLLKRNRCRVTVGATAWVNNSFLHQIAPIILVTL